MQIQDFIAILKEWLSGGGGNFFFFEASREIGDFGWACVRKGLLKGRLVEW